MAHFFSFFVYISEFFIARGVDGDTQLLFICWYAIHYDDLGASERVEESVIWIRWNNHGNAASLLYVSNESMNIISNLKGSTLVVAIC